MQDKDKKGGHKLANKKSTRPKKDQRFVRGQYGPGPRTFARVRAYKSRQYRLSSLFAKNFTLSYDNSVV